MAQFKRWCIRWLLFLFRVFVFLQIGIYCSLTRVWQPYTEIGAECGHEPLPANNSGVKVLVAAFAKMGTRTVTRSLYEVGLQRSYHSEELALHVWSSIAAKFWRRPENAGTKLPVGLPSWSRTDLDLRVLKGTGRGELAAELSRCRVDAISFDAMEELFWPVYEASPDAKVVVLNWRPYEEVVASFLNFRFPQAVALAVATYLSSCIHALPWGLLFRALDPLLGGPIRELLRNGGPPINQVQGPLVMLWYRMVSVYRVTNHYYHGLGNKSTFMVPDEEAYHEFFKRVYSSIPAERRLDFDPRSNTYEDLCRFIGIDACPKSGGLARTASIHPHERDFPVAFCACTLVYLVIHWINWCIVRWCVGRVLSCVTTARPKTE